MVAPRMAAFDAAMMVKSFPVIPSRTSLAYCQQKPYSMVLKLLHDRQSSGRTSLWRAVSGRGSRATKCYIQRVGFSGCSRT